MRSSIGFFLAPAAALLLWFAPLGGLSVPAHRLAAIVAFVVIFWITEAVPLAVTALLGAALIVVCGVAPAPKVLSAFSDPVIFLFIGSFMIARAMQAHRIDQRIAYTLLSHPWVGASSHRSLWTLGLAACLLSMWISNTACTAMLFPVALAIARTAGTAAPRYTTGLLLMLAYAASIGGMATPVGTPPNLIGIALIKQTLGVQVGFVQWMLFGIPLVAVLFLILYGVISLLFAPEAEALSGQSAQMRKARQALGPVSIGECNSLIAFGAAVVLWLGPGLAALWLGAAHPAVAWLSERLPEGVAALLAAGLLFVLPVDWRRRRMTLSWEEACRIDWGTVLLFGGGIALGKQMFDTGLAQALGRGLIAWLRIGDAAGLAAASAASASLISETCSNTASANMIIPVTLSMAESLGFPGAAIGVAATLGASMGFMLPVSTPPNAIVYGSGAVKIADMVKAGLLLDVLGFFVIWASAVWLIPLVVR